MTQPQQQRTAQAPAASQVVTQESQTQEQHQQQESRNAAPRILRLRGRHNTNGRSVQWAEDVVDNEGLGRKKSKVCCIYHKPKAVDESSDESSSSDSSSSDSDSDDDKARRTKRSNDDDNDGHDHDCKHHHSNKGRARRRAKDGSEKGNRPPSPNAYEKVPKQKPKGDAKSDGKKA